jgi:hypothetical protein
VEVPVEVLEVGRDAAEAGEDGVGTADRAHPCRIAPSG